MTEEIKEILNCIDNNVENYYVGTNGCLYQDLTKEQLLLIKNHITNLQKENQSLKEKLNCKEYFSSTMPENTEFVILTKENYDKQQKDLALENIILKSGNEKAIELLKRLQEKYGYMLEDVIFLLLQGGDE